MLKLTDAQKGYGLAALAVVVVVCGAAIRLGWWRAPSAPTQQASAGKRTVTVRFGSGAEVAAEVEETPADRIRGLSGHAPLAPGTGMLFLFDRPDRYVFWMKEMRFPIDIIWIAGGAVVDVTPDAPVPPEGHEDDSALPRYSPRIPADGALEVPAGWAAASGVRAGVSAKTVSP